MVITSKYNGKCTACAGRVLKGMQVNWVRGVKGVTHTDCENPQEGMDIPAEPENFAFQGAAPKKGTVSMTFDLTAMTVEQLKALRDIVEGEVAKREVVAEAA
jgi:hypothetical protein